MDHRQGGQVHLHQVGNQQAVTAFWLGTGTQQRQGLSTPQVFNHERETDLRLRQFDGPVTMLVADIAQCWHVPVVAA